MNRLRYATVLERVPMKGRVLGYATLSDNEGMRHTFYEREFINKLPDLKAGDRVEIEYYSDRTRGNWYIKRDISDEVLDNEDDHA